MSLCELRAMRSRLAAHRGAETAGDFAQARAVRSRRTCLSPHRAGAHRTSAVVLVAAPAPAACCLLAACSRCLLSLLSLSVPYSVSDRALRRVFGFALRFLAPIARKNTKKRPADRQLWPYGCLEEASRRASCSCCLCANSGPREVDSRLIEVRKRREISHRHVR
jgi:hypothetical protein